MSAARIPMMAMTTSNSIRVNPFAALELIFMSGSTIQESGESRILTQSAAAPGQKRQRTNEAASRRRLARLVVRLCGLECLIRILLRFEHLLRPSLCQHAIKEPAILGGHVRNGLVASNDPGPLIHGQ